MQRKSIIGLIVIGVVALVTYTLVGGIGSQVLGGRDEWATWRDANALWFFVIWMGSVVVVTLPTLWFLGRRLDKVISDQEKQAAAAKGVGRIAYAALNGDIAATDRLFDLLEDESRPIKCQAARGLAVLDDREVDKELFRQVRYWQANDKIALINSLASSRDMRTRRLMEHMLRDRDPLVSKQARSSMFAVTPKARREDQVAASVKKTRVDGETVGLGARSWAQTRASGVRPRVGDDEAGERARKSAATSMAPGDRQARAEERAAGMRPRRRDERAAKAAADQPPLRQTASAPAAKPAAGGDAAAVKSGSAAPAKKRPAAGGAPPAKAGTTAPAKKRPPSCGASPAKAGTAAPAKKRPAAQTAPRSSAAPATPPDSPAGVAAADTIMPPETAAAAPDSGAEGARG